MKINNRIFPYPILKNLSKNSTYQPEYQFSLDYETDIDKKRLILKGAHFSTNSKFLLDLYNKGKASAWIICESPQTLFRKKIPLTTEPTDWSIYCAYLNDRLPVTAVLVANDDMDIPSNIDEFIDEYSGISFRLAKGDILAVDERRVEIIDFHLNRDINKSGIFSIYPDDSLQEGQTAFECTDKDVIRIAMSTDTLDAYNELLKHGGIYELFRSEFAIPALIYSINNHFMKYFKEDKSGGDNENLFNEIVDDEKEKYHWFRAFLYAYEAKYPDIKFNQSQFDKLDQVCQTIFDNPNGKTISVINQKLFRQKRGDNGDESLDDDE